MTARTSGRRLTAAERRVTQASDEDLFRRYRDDGDQPAFELLVRRYERPLFAYLRRYLGNADLAEEVFQGTFIQAHRKRDLFEEGRRFRPWIYSLATHQAVDLLRSRGRRQAVSLDQTSAGEAGGNEQLRDMLTTSAPGPLAQAVAAEQRQQVRQAVGDLPEHLRCVVILSFFQELSQEEVAEALEIPVGTVKSRLHAAMKRLNGAAAEGTRRTTLAAGTRPARKAVATRRRPAVAAQSALESMRGDDVEVAARDGLAADTCGCVREQARRDGARRRKG